MSSDDEVRRPSTSTGAMTDATGSLTPESSDEEFVPAERRAIESPAGAEAIAAPVRQRTATEHHPEDAPGSPVGGDEESEPGRY